MPRWLMDLEKGLGTAVFDTPPIIALWNEAISLAFLPDGVRDGCSAALLSLLSSASKAGFQGKMEAICSSLAYVEVAEKFWGRRFGRWRDLSGQSVASYALFERVSFTLCKLSGSVPEAVLNASIKLFANGWATARRMQQSRACQFCGESESSIEHFLVCSVLEACFRKRFGDFRVWTTSDRLF